MEEELIKKYDDWLVDTGPAALVIREHLSPVEGHDAVLFPATFAASQDGTFKGGYNIDDFRDGRNICLIDSVGSQANRIEPIFAREEYRGLVPQIIVNAGKHNINLLEAGHRAGDAIVRCSEIQGELQDAFKAVQRGDCEPLAKIAPTSLVFGVWDSRDTQAKLPRIIASTIRAFDVQKLTRSAQYIPAIEYIENDLLDEPQDKKAKDAYAQRGFIHVPASASHGGVIAKGGIRRDASLHLGALRLIKAGKDEKRTLSLRRYILGIALTAFTYSPIGYLRQGCNLVHEDPASPGEFFAVYPDGRREPALLPHEKALAFAKVAARAFEIEPERNQGDKPDRKVQFDKGLARKDLCCEESKNEKKARKATK